MPIQPVNDVDLFYEVDGDGYPLVMVHGSWNDRFSWMGVVPGLSQSFRVVTYDRRGHGNSSKPGDGTRRDDEDDLAELIEALDIAPCHVAANSFGSSIALSMTARRPELVSRIAVVLDELRAGDIDTATKRFVEEVALGAGMWEKLPEPVQNTFKANAPTFLNELADPHCMTIDLEALAGFSGPVLLTEGDQSPAWFWPILDKLQWALKKSHRHVYEGAGHVPQFTHPDVYVERVTAFIKSSA